MPIPRSAFAGAEPHQLPPLYRNGQIFHNKYILNTFQVEIWPISRLNDSEIQERDLKELKILKRFWGSLPPDPPRSLRLLHSFRKSVSICPRSAPALFCLLSNKVLVVNHLLLAQCLGFHSLVVKTVSQVGLVKASRQKSFEKSS